MRRQQSGFTLIELVMVIVILGVLSAFALPRFANLGGEAKAATLKGALASMKSAAAMAHSVNLARGINANTTIVMEGESIAMLNRYPNARYSSGMARAANLSSTDFGLSFDGTNNKLVVYPRGGVATADCRVEYTSAASDGAKPTFTSVLTDC